MPSGKSKEDTWKAKDLEKSIKEAKDERRRPKDKDRDKDRDRQRDKDRDRPRDKDRDKDREHRKKDKDSRHKDDDNRERRHRDKENDDRGHRDRRREEEKKDRPRKDRDARDRRDRPRRDEVTFKSVYTRADTEKPRPRKPKEADDYYRRETKNYKDEDDYDSKKEHRRHRKEDEDRERRRDRRHDDRDEDREHRRDRQHRDRGHEEDGDRRKHRDDRHDDKERRSKHRDDDKRDRDRDKTRDKGDKDERRRHKDRDDERKPRDKDEDKPRKHRDEDDEERRRRHEERKARKRREEQEEKDRLERERLEKEKEENGDDDYDDDFEDYDDDFEDDADDDDDRSRSSDNDTESQDSRDNRGKKQFNGEVDEIMDAMNRENERLISESRRNKWEDDSDEKPKRPASSTKRTFINFVSAKQRAISKKAMGKVALRGLELQEMIEFDVSEYDMFDMPPVTEYTMYMRSFGSSNTRQAYVQTNEDNIDRELQTEEIEYAEKWTQHPPNEIVASGDPNEKKSMDESEESSKATDMSHLGEFIEKAAQVMTILLEEDFLDTLEHKHSRSKQSNIIISDAFTEVTVPGFLKDRPVLYSHFSPVHTHMLTTLHATSDQVSADPLTRQGCVCVWNVNDPSKPQKILMCESQPRCCCFSPTKTNLVFAGMHDGSVVCWDTREASSMHRHHKHDDTSWLLRYPTYNTAGVLHYENHQSPVSAINTIVAPGESASASLSGLAQAEAGEGLSFQLASLEENGVLLLWVVAELSHSDMAGSESDYGLAPGGKVKLVKSSAIQLESPLRDARLRTTMKCADMQLLPSNNSHYYVTTDTGCVLHGLRYGGKAPPRAYRQLVDNMVQVTSIDFSPFTEPVFLAGCEDGSLRLYHIDNEWPIATWPMSTEGRAIRLVRWCRSRPAVFFVLDSESRLHIWDLLMEDSGPLKQEAVSSHRVTSLTLSNDHSATGLGLPGRRPQMVVCLENGSCEIHTMSQQFSALMADEVDQFAAFLQRNC